MKIIFALDCANKLTNGTTATCLRFADELRKKGHEVVLLSAEFEDGEEHENFVGMPHFHFPIFQPLIEKEGFNFPKTDDAIIYDAVKDADVIHVFLPHPMEKHAQLIGDALGIPVTCAYHLLPQNVTSALKLGKAHFLNEAIFKYFKKYMYDSIRHVHCPSQMTANQLIEHHYTNNQTWVISNGVSSYFQPIEVEKPSSIKDKFVITMVGRLASEKRQDLIVKAVARSKYNKDIQIIFCGQGPDLKRLNELAEKEKLANPLIVNFCNQEQLRNILNYTDLYIHASDFEIEGISCIEAFACGAVPLISDAKLSATNTFSLSPKCVFKAGNVDSLKEGIEWFVENPSEKEELSEYYVNYSKEFGLPRMVDKMELMLETAVEEKRNGEDIPTQSPNKKDIKEMKKIFKKLIKEGVVEDYPEYIKQHTNTK